MRYLVLRWCSHTAHRCMFLFVFMQIWNLVGGGTKWKKQRKINQRTEQNGMEQTERAKARVYKYASYRLKILIIQDFWARKLVWHVLEIKFQSWWCAKRASVCEWVCKMSERKRMSVANEHRMFAYCVLFVFACCLLLLPMVATKNLFRFFWLHFIIKFVKLLVICVGSGLFGALLLLLASQFTTSHIIDASGKGSVLRVCKLSNHLKRLLVSSYQADIAVRYCVPCKTVAKQNENL